MAQVTSDALVFYGATGNLAYKKILPARIVNQENNLLFVNKATSGG